jgi:threonine synthase
MRLICVSCSSTATDAEVEGPNEQVCIRCEGPLQRALEAYEKWDQAVCDIPGVGRYAQLLPVQLRDDLATSDDALRPLSCPRLAQVLGVESVRLMPQTLNATGTFKDNEAVLLAAKSKEWGLQDVCMHSSGNTARAYQYYMERLGVECTGFVPQASAYKCPHLALGRSLIVPVSGNMVTAADAAGAHSEQTGAFRLTPSQWKIEGKVPLGLAMAEHCSDTTVIAVTVASGYGPLGIERGLRRARSVGLPSVGSHVYHLFQAGDAAVLSEAIHEGRDEIDPAGLIAPERAFEPTLQSTNPNRTLPLVRQLLRESGSRIDAVNPNSVVDEAETFEAACAELGVPLEYSTEKSAFICWAGLRLAARNGELRPDGRVVMIVSGSASQEQLA